MPRSHRDHTEIAPRSQCGLWGLWQVSINTPLRKLSPAGDQCAAPHPFPNTVRFMRDAIRQVRSHISHCAEMPRVNLTEILSASRRDLAELTRGRERDPRQLRANDVPERGAGRQTQYLYRGLKDLRPGADFLERGGSELGTMSTTSSLEVALRYAASAAPVLLRLRIKNFMECGADISFCSAFPAESEVPPYCDRSIVKIITEIQPSSRGCVARVQVVFPPQTFILPEGRGREVEGITVIDAAVTVG